MWHGTAQLKTLSVSPFIFGAWIVIKHSLILPNIVCIVTDTSQEANWNGQAGGGCYMCWEEVVIWAGRGVVIDGQGLRIESGRRSD